jgi:hypothetical protein
MFGPGAYRPDPTEGITAIANLPPPEIVSSKRTYPRQACPRCGYTTWGISTSGVHAILWSPIHSTTVRSVASTFTPTSLIWRHPAVSILTA